MNKKTYIAAIDQGTTSSRCVLFTTDGNIAASEQFEHKQYYPRPGWVEHDPGEIWERTAAAVRGAMQKADAAAADIAAVGITNQRETVLAWDPETGKAYGNAIVWQDTRTAELVDKLCIPVQEDLRLKTGLPPATYFSAPTMAWMLEHHPALAGAAASGRLCFGTIDSYLLWRLSGGPEGGVFFTDVTNASRTQLVNLNTLTYDADLLSLFGIPRNSLPEIQPSIPEVPYAYTCAEGPFQGKVAICGMLGDQQAALFGQGCFSPGDIKNTYGTGCFLLMNTGETPVYSENGLLTTLAYQAGGRRPVYALEGSVAVAGALVQWIRDNLGLIRNSGEIETLARSVEDSGGVYFVPAFSGLFAPYWNSRARGLLIGLTGFAGAGHLARAVLEATAFQTKEMFRAMEEDSGLQVATLKADGGMVVNDLLMQFQADILNVPVVRPEVMETTALGAAYAAGLSAGVWDDFREISRQWTEGRRWMPEMDDTARRESYHYWRKAVDRAMDWVD